MERAVNTVELCDIHGHFLPGVDDGCKTTEEAITLLKNSYSQGVRRMFATPHYYPVESVDEFLKRRDEAYARLSEALEGETEIPQICLGAEVAYHPGLGYAQNIDKLCLGTSRYLLLEMPVGRWNREIIRDVRNLCSSNGIIPIVAHVERYWETSQRDLLNRLLEMDVLVQMNAEYLLDRRTQRRGRKLLKTGTVQLLGTDCHNNTDRAPNLGKAAEYLQKKRQTEILERICHAGNALFMEATEG